MSSKKVSLTGEVHISTGSIYTTVDALEAMKVIGLAGISASCWTRAGTTPPSLCRRT